MFIEHPLYAMSKLGAPRIMEWLSEVFIQKKGKQKKKNYFEGIMEDIFSLIFILSLLCRWENWGSERLRNLSNITQLESGRTRSKLRSAWLKKNLPIIILRQFKFLWRLQSNLENICKWENENIKLLTRLKLCKNMFTYGQKVKGNHWIIAVNGAIL